MTKDCNDSCDNYCGLFDFMANTIGIKVLHPGGYQATDKLCSISTLKNDYKVLDLACGTGTTSFHISEKYNCNTTGIDISENLINIANNRLRQTKLQSKIIFEVADALELPYPDNYFDFVIAQAFFILIDNKEKAISEIYRVLKPGGSFGSLELSWFKKPSKIAYDELLEKTCKDFIPRIVLFEDWESFFKSQKFTHIQTIKNPMPGGMLQMIKIEGISNFIRIMLRMMTNSTNRKRMMDVQKTFDKYNDYLGYGLFSFNK